MLNNALVNTEKYLFMCSMVNRHKIAQHFSPISLAQYMASLYEISNATPVLKILDAGAGTGILAIALIERLQEISQIERVELTCYETDPAVIYTLRDNLTFAAQRSRFKVNWEIRTSNYLLDYAKNKKQKSIEKYDLIIGNPPYLKITNCAPEANCFPEYRGGTMNLYALFTSAGIDELKPNGEMVYVIPRSWTSGQYFQPLREKLNHNCEIRHIHLFRDRTSVFGSEIKQEVVVLHIKKSTLGTPYIVVSSSDSLIDIAHSKTVSVPRYLISDNIKYIPLPSSNADVDLLKAVNDWDNTLMSFSLPMKTGLVYPHRCKDKISKLEGPHCVPIFNSNHISNGRLLFHGRADDMYVDKQYSSLVHPNIKYLFVRRIAPKETKRRLNCVAYFPHQYPQYDYVSTHNSLNYIAFHNAPDDMLYGLFAIFNSTYYDRLYRIIDGTTQVNSNLLNVLPLPSQQQIMAIGSELHHCRNSDTSACDSILAAYI